MDALGVLTGHLRLSMPDARAFLDVTASGPSGPDEAAARLGVGPGEALESFRRLERAGGLIEVSGRYMAMHPRFAVVNMYRRACERSGAEFGRNNEVDALGAALEESYESGSV